jgi:S-(hydroxymethyl)glutathione dehydrogenase / alcohol dehydrogenase
MKTTAAVLREAGAALSIERLEIDPPQAGEVLVELKAAGVCHSDLHAASGDWPMTLPVVLGHEGAGIVRAVGEGVTSVTPGTHVVLCWAPACGTCPPCKAGHAAVCDRLDKTNYRNRLPGGGSRLHNGEERVAMFLGTACFSELTVVAEAGVVAVPGDVPFEVLATVGCAVVTGAGAVHSSARVPAGASVAVLGAGGVGLNVIQASQLAGAGPIVAIDRTAAALELALSFGATHAVHSPFALPEAVRDITGGGGADFVFDTVGSSSTIPDAVAATRKGGSTIVTGLGRIDERTALPMFPFVMQDKRLIGSVYGSGNPAHDIARLVALYRDGRLKLRELATRRYRLEAIDAALAALGRGDGARGIVVW